VALWPQLGTVKGRTTGLDGEAPVDTETASMRAVDSPESLGGEVTEQLGVSIDEEGSRERACVHPQRFK